jgi:hypothetical protein
VSPRAYGRNNGYRAAPHLGVPFLSVARILYSGVETLDMNTARICVNISTRRSALKMMLLAEYEEPDSVIILCKSVLEKQERSISKGCRLKIAGVGPFKSLTLSNLLAP